LHTSDWHLGHQLHGVARDGEHAAFLAWLVEQAVAEQVDAVVITGDIFDGSNPPATAQAAYYGFLAEIGARLPGVEVIVLGGNHDSPARLEAPAPLLERLRVRVVGALPRDDHAVAWDRAVVPLHRRVRGKPGPVAAWLLAVPFLRVGDLAGHVDGDGVPVVLDLSPYLRPARWGDAVVVADAVTWHEAGPGLALDFADDPAGRDLLGRALAFRLVAEQLGEQAGDPAAIEPYERIAALLT
ncbi:MAG: exonuclease subunit SbcD, partial [Acidimicrobiales bacterium]|nr:exonuclease subunit SbcD [Acidimicrobiales bacterium]